MTKRNVIKIVAIVLAVVIAALIVFLVVRGILNSLSKGSLKYPDYPTSNVQSDSWEQWKNYDDNEIEIEWYVDRSTFGWPGNNVSEVSDIIREKTGIKIKFTTPPADTSEKLNTMIASNNLPDIVSVAVNSPVRVQLAEQGYAYPIQELTKRWAPTLANRINQEVYDYFAASDGNLYGLPNVFTTWDDALQNEAQGNMGEAVGGLYARRDQLEAYLAANPTATPTTPQGFINMCLWVKENYNLGDTIPVFCLAATEANIASGTGNKGINRLMEYFNVVKEKKDGTLPYEFLYEDENGNNRFLEVMNFLNDLNKNKLLIQSNIGAKSDTINNYISNGYPFVCAVNPQDHTNAFYSWAYANPDKEYVPILITNKDGEAPLISNTYGNGERFNMITSSCKRPDRVIRLFDFLQSEEGQRLLFFGIENQDHVYTVQPGATATAKIRELKLNATETAATVVINDKQVTYKYGQIAWSDEMIERFNKGSSYYTNLGILGSLNIFANTGYIYTASESGYGCYDYKTYFKHNMKAAVTPYTYSGKAFTYALDPTDSRYMDMITTQSRLKDVWVKYVPEMITAVDKDSLNSSYQKAKQLCTTYKYEEYIAFCNEAFAEFKQQRNVEYAWDYNNPDSLYNTVLKKIAVPLQGFPEWKIEVPANLEKKA